MCFKFIDNTSVRFYRRRDSFASPLWKLFDKYYDQFESEYAERYEKVYGLLRPAIGFAVGKFLTCGDLREGFARVHLPAPSERRWWGVTDAVTICFCRILLQGSLSVPIMSSETHP